MMWLFIILLIFFSFLNAFSQSNDAKPNILFIAVDDLKPTIGCFGDSLAITPNIDALAQKGMVFKSTYCQQAVCAPSRASLLTSRYPDQTEVWDLKTLIRDRNPDILTLPQYFRENGYITLGTGKIFDYRSVDNKSDTPSWSKYIPSWESKWYSSITGRPSYYYALPSAKDTIALLEQEASDLGVDKRKYVSERYWPSLELADLPYDAYVDGAIANIGIDVLEQFAGNTEPFFLAVGFQRPHLPFNAPKKFWDLYDSEQFEPAPFQKQAANSPSIAYHNFGELRSYTDIPKSGNLPVWQQKKLIHAYYAATSYIDYLIGMLIHKLEETGLDKNTIIVLWGDHGWHLGDHNLWCKHTNFEQATHSPLIISYPGQPNQGLTYLHPAEFTDIAPTLCDLASLNVPVDFEGESLRQAIENPEQKIREGALSQYPRKQYMGYTLRTSRYRYTKWVDKTTKAHYTAELYDYHADPLETINQAGKVEYMQIKNRLDSLVSERIKIPSTQERVNFQLKKTDRNGDTVQVSDAGIYFAGDFKKTGENGETFFTHVSGEYQYRIKVKGLREKKGSIVFQKDTVIALLLETEEYDVTFTVKADWNNKPLQNALVTIGNIKKVTNDSGSVIFSHFLYDHYNVEVQLENGWKQSFEAVEIFSDTVIALSVAEPKYNARMEVINRYTLNAIYETHIRVNNVEKYTDSKGMAEFSIPEGKYKVSVSHLNYSDVFDSVRIISDTLFFFRLSPSYSTVKFRLQKGTTPINNAKISINDSFEITNNLGIAYFRDWPAYISYHYAVEKEDYTKIQGNLFLVNDTTIDLQIDMLETSYNPKNEREFDFWPNPFHSELYFRSNQTSNSWFSVFSSTGKLIVKFSLQMNQTKRICTKTWQQGIYILKNHRQKKSVTYKIIKV